MLALPLPDILGNLQGWSEVARGTTTLLWSPVIAHSAVTALAVTTVTTTTSTTATLTVVTSHHTAWGSVTTLLLHVRGWYDLVWQMKPLAEVGKTLLR